jgi:hypothetical protein
VICAAAPGTALDVEVVSVHALPFGVPIPSPIGTVDDGLRLANVTLTLPICETVNVPTAVPRTANEPENVSVVVCVGDVEL